MRALGVMAAKDTDSYLRGNQVVIRSNRGIETGLVLCEANEDALSHLDQPPAGHILREFSDDDAKELEHIENSKDEKLAVCQKKIEELNLQMQLVEIEQLLGGERIVIYYLAEDRVDFRDLVKILAGEFQTRIEMKQIGVRDEAKILADYGDCGRPVCCNNHLSQMPPVSMRMAKIQKATLDPTKISGRCGRLKCCLRYEYDTYEEIQKELPRVGAHIVTREGRAKVIGQQILAEQLLVETEDHRRMVIDASEVLSVIKKERNNKEKSSSASDNSPRSTDSRPSKQSDQKGERNPEHRKQKGENGNPDRSQNSADSTTNSGDSPNQNEGSKGKRRNQNRSRKRRRPKENRGSDGENRDNKN